ncbi:gp53-like domain-containing protein [Burkholderia multivorans]|uniref:gp53-like domain-containing protein n=1 Tax=Burkholderia multivorans TaxID=87883 RepID=UPI0021BF730F|nr:hypothetical protein [Burkholderia multivorans]
MTIFIYANNVDTTLAGAISASATSLTLSSSANLPTTIPAGSVFVITLNDRATGQNFEIIYATSITGATLSGLQRGQEGTAAQSWLANDYAYSAPTAGEMNGFGQLGANNTWLGQNTFNNPVSVGNATASGHAMAFGQLPSQFASSLGTNGYKKYPDPNSPTGYFIEQWGSGIFPTQTTSSGQNFPITFPNVVLSFYCSLGAEIPLANFTCVGGDATSTSQFRITVSSTSTGSDGVYWIAKGY